MTSAELASVSLSRHCIERFRARFRPALDAATAGAELEAILPCGRIAVEPPPWLADRRREPDAYLLLGDDVAMPLMRSGTTGQFHAVTCLSRGSISPAERERRNAKRTRRRHRYAVSRTRISPSTTAKHTGN
jgi:hypothetical protein